MNSYSFTLAGNIVPKARARVTSRGTYHAPGYQAWKDGAILDFRYQATRQGISAPIANCSVDIFLFGKHSRRGDADNISGSILDALVQGGILRGDNLNCVPSLRIALIYSKRPPVTKISLRLPTNDEDEFDFAPTNATQEPDLDGSPPARQ